MKKIIFIFPVIIITIISFFSCKDNGVTPVTIQNGPDTTILYTDVNGNILGGDLNDWCSDCQDSLNPCTKLYPPYPNPVTTSFKMNFQIGIRDYVKLYFINNTDTTYLIHDTLNVGYYLIDVSTSTLNLHNTYRKLIMKTKNFNCSGDIKIN